MSFKDLIRFGLALAATAAWLSGCADGLQTKAKPDKGDKGDEDAEGAEEGDGTGTEVADDTTTDDETVDDTTDDDTEVLDDTDPNASVEQLLAECGGGDATTAGPDDVIYEKEIDSLPLTKQVLIVTVTVETNLKIKVTGSKSEQDTLAKVTKVTGLFADFAKAEAEKQAAASSGKLTYTNVPFKEYVDLTDKPSWDGVLCTFVPATKTENKRGGKTTIATFDPPLPASVSPKAAATRFKAEIGEKRTFTGLKAKITSSDHPDLAGKTELEGSVIVEKVTPTIEVPDGSGVAGKTKKITSDLAYKVTTDFGGAKATYALGMAPVVTYYISHSKKDLVANIADTTAAGGGSVVFIHP
jgi:hypothetical protein